MQDTALVNVRQRVGQLRADKPDAVNIGAVGQDRRRGVVNGRLERMTLSANRLENEPGALSRVSGLFSARGFNIEALWSPIRVWSISVAASLSNR